MHSRTSYFVALCCIVTFSVCGIILLLHSHAATPSLLNEPENGTLISPVAKVADVTASGGEAVKFNAPITRGGILSRSGTNLKLNGNNFQFIGFDAFGMTGCRNGTAWSTAQLDSYFASLPANGVTRTWAFQYYGTSRIQAIVTEAAKYNQHLILTLGDDDSACNDNDYAPAGDGSGKKLAFYQSGWKGKYLTWLNTIVPLFKGSPTIALWEIANEPGHVGAKPDALTMKTYLDGAAAAIKAQDPNHLVSSGANCGCDGGLADYAYAHSGPGIDVISFHDYSYEYENKAVISGNFQTAKSAAITLNKPFIAGEAGVQAGTSCAAASLTTRSTFLKQKSDTYMTGGIGGILFWDYEPLTTRSDCSYEIDIGDPFLPIVKNYLVP